MSCPYGAIHQDKEAKLLEIDEEKCFHLRPVRDPLQAAGDQRCRSRAVVRADKRGAGWKETRCTSPRLQCVHCGQTYSTEEVDYYCPACGYHDGILDVLYDYDAVRQELNAEALAGNRDLSMWRYLPLLPVANAGADSAFAGGLDAAL